MNMMKGGEKTGVWIHERSKSSEKKLLEFETFKEGVLEGAFKAILSDSIIFGNYRNNETNGKCIFYSSYYALLSGLNFGDTSTALKISRVIMKRA